ncbi:leucine--tRNA ligase [Candidatus Tremblaya phenacola]|uniref:leucine--tRNA ligase n=1 Tax=Candidatus Tremblayella phenacoccinincola TaxID=1010676 RepID=UPI00132FE915|nr:leucine--tRNA ligase [Candidatus Tremblaya phenacola]KAH0998307.1 Leucyl-tRNA synthetase [Candidatus Tremblaya phenacola]
MDVLYYHKEIEANVQEYWGKSQIFKATESIEKEKHYCLSMLPYPSGKLHMGHIRNYTIGDTIARYQRMQGISVLNPIGWDAFGLPAESAAVNNKSIPSEWTYNNIKYMRKQLKPMGFSFDWSRELITCKPEFYIWEQWLYVFLYNKELAYKSKTVVNWCPTDKTVLANEQAVNGCCWRCNNSIAFKRLSQWFIKITSYADDLLKELAYLTYWPINIKDMQRSWIGKSKGIGIVFNIEAKDNSLNIYAINPELLLKATYIYISVYHCLSLLALKKNVKEVKGFITGCLKTKLGEPHSYQEELNTDLYAINPLTNIKLSVWVVKHIIKDYGTGISIGIPSIYIEDFSFAINHRLPTEICIENKSTYGNPQKPEAIMNKLIKTNKCNQKINYSLKDWCISRQRIWGVPMPMLLKPKKVVPVAAKELPILLDESLLVNSYMLVTNIKKNVKWYKVIYKGKDVYREPDTFDTFLESSWYYIRYVCPDFRKSMIDIKATNYWLPVDQYIGGIEHAIMHLLYFRLYYKLLRDAGLVGFSYKEPVRKLFCQGMVLAEAFYYVDKSIKWVSPLNVVTRYNNKDKLTKLFDLDGNEVKHAGIHKMSKSKNNGTCPGKVLEIYGADALRLFIMFAAPANIDIIWKQSGIEGSYRFLNKVWKIVYEHVELRYVLPFDVNSLNKEQLLLYKEVNKSIINIVKDIKERHSFNTSIASIMKIVSKLVKMPKIKELDYSLSKELLNLTIKVISPFVPHICSILWKELNNRKAIEELYWFNLNKTTIEPICLSIIVQINNKVRGSIEVPMNIGEALIKDKLYLYEKALRYFKTKKAYKIIYIPNKIINILALK